MNLDAFGNEQLGGGTGAGGGGGKAASSSSSSTSGNNFGGFQDSDGGLTPLAGVILGGVALLAFVALVVVARK